MSCECQIYDMVIPDVIPIMGDEFHKETTMNQPDLGAKVTELRQQKNMTQEQLAEKCEVSTRKWHMMPPSKVGRAHWNYAIRRRKVTRCVSQI